MKLPFHNKFVNKAESALIAAIEIFNKPAFKYREETFAILALNAWELILKAKLLKDGDNDPKKIRVYERKKTKGGSLAKKLTLKRNRSGSPLTISVVTAISRLDDNQKTRIPVEVKANIDALIAIRDNATHYITASDVLAKQVLEIASATVKNFILLTKEWFGRNLSDSISLVLPLAFINGSLQVDSVIITKEEDRLIKYLQGLANVSSSAQSNYSVALRIQAKFERSKLSSASKVQVSSDPDAIKVTMTEEDIREKYPMDYGELIIKLSSRYTDFVVNKKFHGLRMPLKGDQNFVYSRQLDPGNPRSGRKDFYSSRIFEVLDKHYTAR
ncbi:MAG: DUF3644 domain-containing protein [bacterium]